MCKLCSHSKNSISEEINYFTELWGRAIFRTLQHLTGEFKKEDHSLSLKISVRCPRTGNRFFLWCVYLLKKQKLFVFIGTLMGRSHHCRWKRKMICVGTWNDQLPPFSWSCSSLHFPASKNSCAALHLVIQKRVFRWICSLMPDETAWTLLKFLLPPSPVQKEDERLWLIKGTEV